MVTLSYFRFISQTASNETSALCGWRSQPTINSLQSIGIFRCVCVWGVVSAEWISKVLYSFARSWRFFVILNGGWGNVSNKKSPLNHAHPNRQLMSTTRGPKRGSCKLKTLYNLVYYLLHALPRASVNVPCPFRSDGQQPKLSHVKVFNPQQSHTSTLQGSFFCLIQAFFRLWNRKVLIEGGPTESGR